MLVLPQQLLQSCGVWKEKGLCSTDQQSQPHWDHTVQKTAHGPEPAATTKKIGQPGLLKWGWTPEGSGKKRGNRRQQVRTKPAMSNATSPGQGGLCPFSQSLPLVCPHQDNSCVTVTGVWDGQRQGDQRQGGHRGRGRVLERAFAVPGGRAEPGALRKSQFSPSALETLQGPKQACVRTKAQRREAGLSSIT